MPRRSEDRNAPLPEAFGFLALLIRQTGLATEVNLVTRHPVPKTALADPKTSSSLSDRVPLSDHIQGTTPELRRVSSRHYTDSFRDDHRLTHGVR